MPSIDSGDDGENVDEVEEEEEEDDDAIEMTFNIIRKPSSIMKRKHIHPVPVVSSMPASIERLMHLL